MSRLVIVGLIVSYREKISYVCLFRVQRSVNGQTSQLRNTVFITEMQFDVPELHNRGACPTNMLKRLRNRFFRHGCFVSTTSDAPFQSQFEKHCGCQHECRIAGTLSASSNEYQLSVQREHHNCFVYYDSDCCGQWPRYCNPTCSAASCQSSACDSDGSEPRHESALLHRSIYRDCRLVTVSLSLVHCLLLRVACCYIM